MRIATEVVPVMFAGEAKVDAPDTEGEVQALNDVEQRGEVRADAYLAAAVADGSMVFGFEGGNGRPDEFGLYFQIIIAILLQSAAQLLPGAAAQLQVEGRFQVPVEETFG